MKRDTKVKLFRFIMQKTTSFNTNSNMLPPHQNQSEINYWKRTTCYLLLLPLCYVVFGYTVTFFWVEGVTFDMNLNPFTWPHLVGAVYMTMWVAFIYFMFVYFKSCEHATNYPHSDRDHENNSKCNKYTCMFSLFIVALIAFFELVVWTYQEYYTE